MNGARLLFVIFGTCVAQIAPASGIKGPVSGYVLDHSSGSIRPLNGFPGGAVLGDPLQPGRALIKFAYASESDLAIAADAEHRPILITGLSGEPRTIVKEDWLSSVDLLALSPSGSSAALYSKAEARIQVIRDLTDTASIAADIDTSSVGEVLAIAVHEGSILVAARNESIAALYHRDSSGGSLEAIASFDSPVSVAFSNNGSDAVVADRGSHQVLLIAGLRGSRVRILLASERDGVVDPMAAHALDGDRIVVASGEPAVHILNLATRGIETVPLNSPPTRCEPLSGRNLIALTEAGDRPLLILEANPQAAVWFVPPAQAEVTSGTGVTQ